MDIVLSGLSARPPGNTQSAPPERWHPAQHLHHRGQERHPLLLAGLRLLPLTTRVLLLKFGAKLWG